MDEEPYKLIGVITIAECPDRKKQPYKLIRVITPTECPWLKRSHETDEIVFKYYGHTFGCIGKNGSAFCKEIDSPPFFELPNDAVSII